MSVLAYFTSPAGLRRVLAGMGMRAFAVADQEGLDDVLASLPSAPSLVIARVALISGHVEGNVTAIERVVLDSTATVRAHLQTPSIVIMEGAHFTGTVDPSRTEAALHVAKYRQKQG